MEAVVKQHHLIFGSFVDGGNIILNAYASHKNCTAVGHKLTQPSRFDKCVNLVNWAKFCLHENQNQCI